MKICEFRLKFHWSLFLGGPINNIPALVPLDADQPLSEPMMIILLTHICSTQPQWVNFQSLITLMRLWHAELQDLPHFSGPTSQPRKRRRRDSQPAPVTPSPPPPKPATAATGMQTVATIQVCQFVVESPGITAHVSKYLHSYPWLNARMT